MQSAAQDDRPWYAVRLFGTRQGAVGDYLKEQGVDFFVPMHYVDQEVKGANKVRRVLKPVVTNLIFIKKQKEQKEMRAMLMASPYKMSVYKKERFGADYYEISAREMHEFQVMCNPEIELRKYVSEQEAKLKQGARVIVKYGPLKGLSGRLVRQSKKYFLLKEVPGMGVMLKVSRWCCVADDH